MEKDVVVVEIPKVLADEVNRVRVLLGYTSLSEFIRDAIRRRLEDVQHAISQSEEE
jgi:metal-responsive CopG/Arc/MetJ family transcriptional regulator